MESQRIGKQMVGFQKTMFDNGYNTLSVFQDQAENMITGFWGQFPFVTEEGKKQVDEAFSYTRKAREDFKKVIDESYSQVEKLFDMT